jgi:hypothetical protein
MKLKVNDLAEYHGSRTHFHGTVVIVGAMCGHYDVAYATDPSKDVQLRGVRETSLTPIDARAYWGSFKTCRGCGSEHNRDKCPICN